MLLYYLLLSLTFFFLFQSDSRFLAEKELNARLPSPDATARGTRRTTGVIQRPFGTRQAKHCRIMRSRRSVARDTLENPIIIREVARLFRRTSTGVTWKPVN